MSSDTTTEAPEEVEEEVEVDEAREARLEILSNALGDLLVESHIEPGRDIWVRVRGDEWGTVADIVRNQVGLRYFAYLSVIDWLPSPFGRSMDSEVDNVLERGGESGSSEAGPGDGEPNGEGSGEADAENADAAPITGPSKEMTHGITGGETRFQTLARVDHIGEVGNYWGVTLKADIPDDTLTIDSWTSAYAGADWHEREAWEMFGITFTGHPGLRNIYLPSEFEGYPLRKDFPLLARMVKPWPGIVDVEPLPTDGEASDGEESDDADAGGDS